MIYNLHSVDVMDACGHHVWKRLWAEDTKMESGYNLMAELQSSTSLVQMRAMWPQEGRDLKAHVVSEGQEQDESLTLYPVP